MAKSNRIFISFAFEDVTLRDFIVGQAKHDKSPFSFVDMSVKQPWDEAWKAKCRTRIRGCDGVIGLVTGNTPYASGQLWELDCAYAEGLPVLLMYGHTEERPTKLPAPINGKRVLVWSWENIANFLKKL